MCHNEFGVQTEYRLSSIALFHRSETPKGSEQTLCLCTLKQSACNLANIELHPCKHSISLCVRTYSIIQFGVRQICISATYSQSISPIQICNYT